MAYKSVPTSSSNSKVKTQPSFLEHFNFYEKSVDEPYWTPEIADRNEFVSIEDSSVSLTYGTDVDPNSTVVVKMPRMRLLKDRFELSSNPNVADMERMSLASDRRQLETLANLQSFSVNTNMVVTQENGQRIAGPPKDYDGNPPPKRCEVFVGRLHREVTEPLLYDVFSRIGRVYKIRLMLDHSGANRGYCFVKYCNPLDAQNAATNLDNFEILPYYPIGVMMSVDDCRIMVSGLPKTKSRHQILREMKQVTEGVTDVILHDPIEEGTKNRGYAYVDYVSHKHSAVARKRLCIGKGTVFDEKVSVGWAQPEPDNPILMVRDIAVGTTDSELRCLFNLYGSGGVTRILRRGFAKASIKFVSKEKADAARIALDGQVFNERAMQVKWCKPNYEDGSTYAYTRRIKMAEQSETDYQGGSVTAAYAQPVPIMDIPFQSTNHGQLSPGQAYYRNLQLGPMYFPSPDHPTEWSGITMDPYVFMYYGGSPPIPVNSPAQAPEPGTSRMSLPVPVYVPPPPPRMSLTPEQLAPGSGRLVRKAKAGFEIGIWNEPEPEQEE